MLLKKKIFGFNGFGTNEITLHKKCLHIFNLEKHVSHDYIPIPKTKIKEDSRHFK